MRITLNNDTKAILNGINVVFPQDTIVDFVEADSMAYVAELCSAGKLHIDLSHKDGDEMVRYGAGGKEYREAIVAVETPKVAKKKATKTK